MTDGTAQESPPAAKDQDAPAKEVPTAQAKKGRPTPKRSAAQAGRYQSIQGGRSSGARATSGARPSRPLTDAEKSDARARERAERARRTDAMKRGEDWALGPRDRGAARKIARDYVDAHRRPSEFYMYFLIVLFVGIVSHNKAFTSISSYLVAALVFIIVVDGLLIRNALRKLIAERAPGESTRGLTMYAVMRALQIRRMRMPAPRLKPGDKA
ncbi:MAG TPA: DUF3043 domain-containing protein [Trebonia sp.]|nr:DUF3043 domain-containing protein [Trebonia sp.]